MSVLNRFFSKKGIATENRVDNHTHSTAVSLSSYTSSSNAYICPTDGYVMALSGSQLNDLVFCVVDGMNLLQARCETNNYAGRSSIFVKKGMPIYVEVNTGNRGYIYYYALQ